MTESPDSLSGPIVVGVDATDESLKALRVGANLARAFERHVVVTFVRRTPAIIGDTPETVAVDFETALDDSEKQARKFAADVLDPVGITWQMEVRHGEPGPELVDVGNQNKASFVVVGATIHGVVTSIVLASVASYLLHHCHISFVVVRPDHEQAVVEPEAVAN